MDQLSKQDQDFVKEVAITGNQTQAAKKVYKLKDTKYASVKGTRLLAKDSIKTAVAEVKRTLAEQIPDELLVEKHLELLNVPKIITTRIKGEITDVEESTDVQALKAGLDMAYKLKGAYAPEKSISLNMNADIANPRARALAEKYEDELKKNL